MHLELHHIAPLRAANVISLLYGLSMVLFAVPMFLLLAVLPDPSTTDPQQARLALANFRWFLLAYPVFGLVFGWLAGLVGAQLYNLIAPQIGGLCFEFESTQATS